MWSWWYSSLPITHSGNVLQWYGTNIMDGADLITIDIYISLHMQDVFHVSMCVIKKYNSTRSSSASSAHLCDIVPHAPCLLVRMLRIFCFSWFAVTWSLCFAALMRWSHIFSSSLRSAAYWAQLDWRRGVKQGTGTVRNQRCVRDEEIVVYSVFVCWVFRWKTLLSRLGF